MLSYIRKKKYRPATTTPATVYVTLRLPPQDSETGSTGELWSNTNLLKWQNQNNSILFILAKKVFFLLKNYNKKSDFLKFLEIIHEFLIFLTIMTILDIWGFYAML